MSSPKRIALAISTGPMNVFLSEVDYTHLNNVIINNPDSFGEFDLSLFAIHSNKIKSHKPYGKSYRNMPFKR